ncbi:MAG: hypothetical protein J5750_07735 [Clostridiales bacterium]|nr:hypothetical protein [Clostridiales bacterium]
MHRVLEFDEAEMTRSVVLKNLLSGTVDRCFDDSELVSDDSNFSFMRLNGEYDCKIELFGEITTEEDEKAICCKVMERDVLIGKRSFIKVRVGQDEYYIRKPEPDVTEGSDTIWFWCTRKDLRQVNHVIRADLQM